MLLIKYLAAVQSGSAAESKQLYTLLLGEEIKTTPKLTKEEYEHLDIDIEKTGIKLN